MQCWKTYFTCNSIFLVCGQSITVMDSLLSIHSTIMDSFLSTQEVLDESTLILLGSEARRKGAKLTYFHHASGHFVLVKLEDTGFYNRQMCMLKNCYQT